jgi:hypothetical protein
MDEKNTKTSGGTDVDAERAYGKAMEGRHGTVQEDVSPGHEGREARQSGELSTADIVGRGSDAEQRPSVLGAPPSERSAPEAQAPLFPEAEAEKFHQRWQQLQASFVDNPRDTVQQGDTLVAEVMQRLAQTFSDERKRLEGEWERGGDVSTEDLRMALQRYRSFFTRLLTV